MRTKSEPLVALGRYPVGSTAGPSRAGGIVSGQASKGSSGFKVNYQIGDQVVIQSKEDGMWYRVVVEDVKVAGEVIVSFGSKDLGQETVPAIEIDARLRQRTIHLEGLPPGWTGRYLLRLPDGSRDHPSGDLHLIPPPPAASLRSIKAAKEFLDGDLTKQAMIDQAVARMQAVKPFFEQHIRDGHAGGSNISMPSHDKWDSGSETVVAASNNQSKGATARGAAAEGTMDVALPKDAYTFLEGDEILAELRGCWYKSVKVVSVSGKEVLIDFGDEREMVPAEMWRSRLFNRTVHISDLPPGWRGLYVLRDMPAPNAMTRTGDFFFYVDDGKGGHMKIRSCKEARLIAQAKSTSLSMFCNKRLRTSWLKSQSSSQFQYTRYTHEPMCMLLEHMEHFPNNTAIMSKMEKGIELARSKGAMMAKHMRSQDSQDADVRVEASPPRNSRSTSTLAEYTMPPSNIGRQASWSMGSFQQVCWDCKRGSRSSQKPHRARCRETWGHTGPDWSEDPRESAAVMRSAAAAHVRNLQDDKKVVAKSPQIDADDGGKVRGERGVRLSGGWWSRDGRESAEERRKAREERTQKREEMRLLAQKEREHKRLAREQSGEIGPEEYYKDEEDDDEEDDEDEDEDDIQVDKRMQEEDAEYDESMEDDDADKDQEGDGDDYVESQGQRARRDGKARADGLVQRQMQSSKRGRESSGAGRDDKEAGIKRARTKHNAGREEEAMDDVYEDEISAGAVRARGAMASTRAKASSKSLSSLLMSKMQHPEEVKVSQMCEAALQCGALVDMEVQHVMAAVHVGSGRQPCQVAREIVANVRKFIDGKISECERGQHGVESAREALRCARNKYDEDKSARDTALTKYGELCKLLKQAQEIAQSLSRANVSIAPTDVIGEAARSIQVEALNGVPSLDVVNVRQDQVRRAEAALKVVQAREEAQREDVGALTRVRDALVELEDLRGGLNEATKDDGAKKDVQVGDADKGAACKKESDAVGGSSDVPVDVKEGQSEAMEIIELNATSNLSSKHAEKE